MRVSTLSNISSTHFLLRAEGIHFFCAMRSRLSLSRLFQLPPRVCSRYPVMVAQTLGHIMKACGEPYPKRESSSSI